MMMDLKSFLAYTVEDPYREKKIKHITRFADGRYQIKFRAVGGFQSRYLKRYGAEFHSAGMLGTARCERLFWCRIYLCLDPRWKFGEVEFWVHNFRR